jgi:hypothetical protein
VVLYTTHFSDPIDHIRFLVWNQNIYQRAYPSSIWLNSDLSLSSLYWYVAACDNGGNLTTDHIRVSHFLPFTGMSRRVITEETSLRITFESLTFFPLLVCCGVWEQRKPHYGSHSSLSLSYLYWYVAACENGGNLTMDHIRVTLCHKYIVIARSMQNSLLTFHIFAIPTFIRW